ncbi:A disintegrin and metalloproteinase with thrombospondin motifs 16-like isoform X3 [Xenia sp. Carnegie-2017]|uniref:A disintegrin and metalloproteinase with thrombospondin motifs 16-like isoform X3 n=1 Tax=Xenia sp. Carnegie-2017 TaxID=2897299 RepID=UPI001F0421A6|nr:A disintegrin and metalloproteinase with thrombospondin motifs 16-like isoform X3 [Xenia sp. Carnegie-2017]
MEVLSGNGPCVSKQQTNNVRRLLIVMAIFCCISAQEYQDSETQNMLNNKISQFNSAQRFRRYDSKDDMFGIRRRNCKTFLDCEEEKASPKVTYQDAYRTRAEQCTEFNRKAYNGRNIKWKPYLNDNLDECKLFCMAEEHKFYAQLRNSVRDGTPCVTDHSKVCIKGKCQDRPSGCPTLDGPCLSGKKKKILGVFNTTILNTGYNLATTIPNGATNITVEELERSRNYLALKYHESGEYLLNGHWMISLSKTFQILSSNVIYDRNGNTRRGREVVTIDGPLEKALDIMVLYRRDLTVLKYSYFVTEKEYNKLKMKPLNNGEHLFFPKAKTTSVPTYQQQKNEGDVLAEQGESITFKAGERVVENVGEQRETQQSSIDHRESESVPFLSARRGRPRSERRGDITLPNTGGHGFNYPQVQTRKQTSLNEDENHGDKQATLYGSSWVQFGGDPIQRSRQASPSESQPAARPVLKQQVFKPNRFTGHATGQVGYRAENRFDKSDAVSYQREPWGHRGFRTGITRNQRPRWQNTDSKKQFYASSQAKDGVSHKYLWKIVAFTPCSSSCAGGVQSGIVKCTEALTGATVADSKCNLNTRIQQTRRVCNLQPCPATWEPQEWKACSKSCGEGRQTRDLMCKQTKNENGGKVTVMVPVVECPSQRRPEVIRNCFIKECPERTRPKWVVGDWKKCSVECGHGVQKRDLVCKNTRNETMDESQCGWIKKPTSMKACYQGLCRADWYVRTEWSQCSRSCESGTRSRPVVCARIEGNKIQEKHCRDKSKPEHEQQCNAQKCAGMWMTSEWSQCSVDCGQGVQQRHVLCMKNVNGNYKETFDSECSVDNKPAVRKECSRNCVPSWFATPWSQCSLSCGTGVQTRHVSCLDGQGTRVGGCKAWERPPLRRQCKLKKCPGSQTDTTLSIECRDNPPRTFKRYCHIIKRINYCRIPSYGKRCCETCSSKGKILGHL